MSEKCPRTALHTSGRAMTCDLDQGHGGDHAMLGRSVPRLTWADDYGQPTPVAVVPRWWTTTDKRTMDRLRFLPEYEYRGDPIVVGMYAAWDGGDMRLACDPITGEYFRKGAYHGAPYGRVFAPAPPPIGLWSGEGPFMNEGDDHV